jgi:hypothetical protein
VRSSGVATGTEPPREGFGATPKSEDASIADVKSAFASYSALRDLTLASLFSTQTAGSAKYVPKRYRFATLPVDVQMILRQLKEPK